MPPVAEATTETAAPELDMLQIAAEADAARDATTTAPEKSEAAAPAAAPQETTGLPSATGKDAKKPDAPAAPDAAKKDGDAKPDAKAKKETPFEKAKQDADRRDRSWKALEEEKAQVRAEKARYEADLAAARRELSQLKAKPAGPATDEHGATADNYRALAKQYAAEGNDEMATAAEARAKNLDAKSAAPATSAGPAAPDSPEFKAAWQQHTQELIAADPDLANPASPVVKAANVLLDDANYGRFFRSHPDGIKAAVEVARLMSANAQAAQVTQELTATKAELAKAHEETKRLNALLQPRGSHPAGQPGAGRKIEDMNPEEAAAAIQALARAADRGELP